MGRRRRGAAGAAAYVGQTAPVPDSPTVSVVIPAYNAERWIRDSVTSVLAQTWTDLECIVVDDGSTDGTAAALATFEGDERLRCIRKENRRTVSDARNAGIAEAKGRFIAFLDADDVWRPTKLERQLPLFDDDDVVLVYCGYAIADVDLRPGTVIAPPATEETLERWLLLEGNGIAPSSTGVLRADAARRAGPFELELSVSEDLDFATRVAALGRIAMVPECLVLYRCHGSQGHTDLARFEHDMRWILDDRFGRSGSRDWARWRRGTANLCTRLAVYHLRERNAHAAAARLWEALMFQPRRVIALPLEAMVRRARRTLRRLTG